METFTLIVISTGVTFFALTCYAILDIAKKDFDSIKQKALWSVITLTPFIGPILYFTIGYRKGKTPQITDIESK
jgi:hypothetical protein